MDTILQFEIAGNRVWRITALFGIILIALLVGKILKYILQRYGEKFEKQQHFITSVSLFSISRGVVFLFAAFGISIGLAILKLESTVAQISDTLSAILLTIGVGYFLYRLVDVPYKLFFRMAEKTESKLDDMLVPVVRKTLRITIVILVLVQIAQILSDKPITSIIAGLGIGGLAIALAAQDSIKNFFGSIVLFTDKPFEIGDRLIVDGHDGPVEQVGLRSTRIRTLDGHLITIPNGELANKTIQNIGRRPYIKRIANITITYDTPPEKVDKAIEILKELLENHEGMHEDFPPRVFFNNFNSDSLNLLVMYWYHPPEYWDYMAYSEKINKEILYRFNEEGIDFAFPSQTVYLAGDSSSLCGIVCSEAPSIPAF
ncbi:mechanosensitive ion channel family protein [Thermodesulfobacteriota bacterium]